MGRDLCVTLLKYFSLEPNAEQKLQAEITQELSHFNEDVSSGGSDSAPSEDNLDPEVLQS